jgi:hypothetical protein
MARPTKSLALEKRQGRAPEVRNRNPEWMYESGMKAQSATDIEERRGAGGPAAHESLSSRGKPCLFRVMAESRVKGQIDNARPHITADLEIIEATRR